MKDPKLMTSEQAVKLLKQHGVLVTIDQAQKILELNYRTQKVFILSHTRL